MILGRTVHLIWIMVMIGRILMISIMVRLNSSGPKGSSGALLIRTLDFSLSGGNLIMIMSMVIFTLDIVVMIIVVMIKIITMMSDVPRSGIQPLRK